MKWKSHTFQVHNFACSFQRSYSFVMSCVTKGFAVYLQINKIEKLLVFLL